MPVFSRGQHFLPVAFLLVVVTSELYPSIQWTPQNPTFATNRTQCFHPMSSVIFVCPNTAMVVTKRYTSVLKNELYENLWLVSRRSYERCQVDTSDPAERRLLECNTPLTLKYYMMVFQKYSADDKPEFVPGNDYYFIATSDGSPGSVQQTSGGHCKTHNMKFKFHICTDNKDPHCYSDELCNGDLPASTTTKPQDTTAPAATTSPLPTGNSTCGHDLQTTVNYPGEPGDRAKMFFSELSYQIAVGFLLATCLLLLVITGILSCRLHRKWKLAAPGASSSSSFAVRLSRNRQNSDSCDGLLWEDEAYPA